MEDGRGMPGLAKDLAAACGAGLVWKDAHPTSDTDRRLREHRNPYCLAVKADPHRLRRCLRSDNVGPDPVAGLRCRTCPFGVVEVAVTCAGPLSRLGFAWVGSWRAPRFCPPPRLAEAWSSLPVFPGRTRVMAIARLAQARLGELLAARRPTPECNAEQRGDARMRASAAWISTHARASLRSSEAAQQAGLSLSRFHHRFSAATGSTFADHRDACLMAAAQRGLASGRSVTAVALELGFSSQSRFSELFRRHAGMPPSLWRSRHAVALA